MQDTMDTDLFLPAEIMQALDTFCVEDKGLYYQLTCPACNGIGKARIFKNSTYFIMCTNTILCGTSTPLWLYVQKKPYSLDTTILNKPYWKRVCEKIKSDIQYTHQALLGYQLTKFNYLAHTMQGLQAGLYIIGAHTNIGKTAFSLNIALDILRSNSDVCVLYISLDDSENTITNRLVALLTELPMNDIPYFHTYTDIRAQHIMQAYATLCNWSYSHRLDVCDFNSVTTLVHLEEKIKQFLTKKIVVIIDGVYNLSVEEYTKDIRDEHTVRACKLKQLAQKYTIPLLVTAEVRKKPVRIGELNAYLDMPPTYHDLLEANKLSYNAHVIWMLHPAQWQEFKHNPTPILYVHVEKNKLSSFKGLYSFMFEKQTGIFKQLDVPEQTIASTQTCTNAEFNY